MIFERLRASAGGPHGRGGGVREDGQRAEAAAREGGVDRLGLQRKLRGEISEIVQQPLSPGWLIEWCEPVPAEGEGIFDKAVPMRPVFLPYGGWLWVAVVAAALAGLWGYLLQLRPPFPTSALSLDSEMLALLAAHPRPSLSAAERKQFNATGVLLVRGAIPGPVVV